MIGTSPPKQNAVLSVTDSARMVVTAASTALPPLLSIAMPASTASCPPAATAPFLPAACHVPPFGGWTTSWPLRPGAVAREKSRMTMMRDMELLQRIDDVTGGNTHIG